MFFGVAHFGHLFTRSEYSSPWALIVAIVDDVFPSVRSALSLFAPATSAAPSFFLAQRTTARVDLRFSGTHFTLIHFGNDNVLHHGHGGDLHVVSPPLGTMPTPLRLSPKAVVHVAPGRDEDLDADEVGVIARRPHDDVRRAQVDLVLLRCSYRLNSANL